MSLFNENLVGYAVQFLILVQPLLWINLLRYSVEFKRENNKPFLFYLLALLSILVVYVFHLEIGFYRTHLIIQYILYTCLAFYMYSNRFSVMESIALAFLTVYLNSFYWELPYHVAELNYMDIIRECWFS